MVLDWAAIANGLVAMGFAANALTPPQSEGKANNGADAGVEPETGHPAVGAVAERAAPNKAAVDAGPEAVAVVEALVPAPNELIIGVVEYDENENDEAAVTTGTEGAVPWAVAPKSPKVTWVNNAPGRTKHNTGK